MSLDSLFYPKGVAVVGSAKPGKLGYILLKKIIDGGYNGFICMINPKAEGALEKPGYASFTKAESPVDLAIIVTPPATVANVLDDCGKGGVKAAVIITAGFSEMGNTTGEAEVLAAAKRNNIRIVGPNCAGIVCTSSNLFPTLEVHPPKGGVALLSQSGALGGVVLGWAAEQNIGMSKFVSYGNGIDINQVELLHYFKNDPETKVVALYIESIKNGREFMEALEACAREKPVVVIKSGRTNVGRRAASSHTGSMAGSDAVYDAAFAQCGAIRVKTIEEMIDLCDLFTTIPPLAGNRVVIITNSGGPGVLAADMGEEIGLNMAPVSPETISKLKEFLPAHCGFGNPIDLTAEGNEDGYRKTLLTVLDEYDAAVVLDICPPYLDASSHAKGVADAADISGKPIVTNFLPNQVVKNSVAYLKERKIPNFSSGERAVRTLKQMADSQKMRAQLSAQPGFAEVEASLKQRIGSGTKSLPCSGQMLEPDAMAWLRDNGIPVPAFSFVSDETAAVKACAKIGFPCVMKVVSPKILHKSDFGGVIVGIQSEEEAAEAFKTIKSRAEGMDFRGVVIYPQIKGSQEVLLGLATDPQFGSVVVFGIGGIYTEIMHDIALRIAPVSVQQAMEMIHSIKGIKLLEGVRGSKPCDLEKLAEMISRFSELPFIYPEIGEADLNPVFIDGETLYAGDVRVIRKIAQ